MSEERLTVAAALRSAGLDPPDARILLEHVLATTHARLISYGERVLTMAESNAYSRLVARRRDGEPIAYLVGWREFYGRRFAVDPSVLIPRPESELLVDLALERIDAKAQAAALDLATGSGNIAVTLALERRCAAVVATDLSASALACARANASRLGAELIEFLAGDWFEPLAGRRFDLIAANPPYVADGDAHLRRGDLRFEPRSALAAGADGLDAIRTIVAQSGRHLNPGGWLLFEHGHDQGTVCIRLLDEAGFADIAAAKDLAGLPRVSGGRLR
jgi:release factor glutamine methyltransferase